MKVHFLQMKRWKTLYAQKVEPVIQFPEKTTKRMSSSLFSVKRGDNNLYPRFSIKPWVD